MDNFSILVVLCRIYIGLELFLILGWIYCKGMEAGVRLISSSGVVWWGVVDLCVSLCTKLLLEHSYECMSVFKYDQNRFY